MIKPIYDFARLFNASIALDEDSIVEKHGKYYLLSSHLLALGLKDFIYVGTYLGEAGKKEFSPGFGLLRIIAQGSANKIVVDKKTEWLFVCGRDVFMEGIINAAGSRKKCDYVLVLNRYEECLGYGRIVHDLNKRSRGVVVENLLDVGDFLRRER